MATTAVQTAGAAPSGAAPHRKVVLPFAGLLIGVLGVAGAVGFAGHRSTTGTGDDAATARPATAAAVTHRTDAPAQTAVAAASPSPTRVDLTGQLSAAVAQDRSASAAWSRWVTGVSAGPSGSDGQSAVTVSTRLTSATSGGREASVLCSAVQASAQRLGAAFDVSVSGSAGTALATCHVGG